MRWGLGIGDWGLGIGDWAQSPFLYYLLKKHFFNKNNFNHFFLIK